MKTRQEFIYLLQLLIIFLVLMFWKGLFLLLSPVIFIILLGFFIPKWRTIVISFWSRLGLWLQNIFSPVLFTVIFFCFVVSLGFIMRLFGRDELGLRRAPANSNYHDMKKEFGPDDFERMG